MYLGFVVILWCIPKLTHEDANMEIRRESLNGLTLEDPKQQGVGPPVVKVIESR